MNLQSYLERKHELNSKEKKLKPISVKQYVNRFENMCKAGVYNEEREMDAALILKIQQNYKDWKTYVRTIRYYIESKKYE